MHWNGDEKKIQKEKEKEGRKDMYTFYFYTENCSKGRKKSRREDEK